MTIIITLIFSSYRIANRSPRSSIGSSISCFLVNDDRVQSAKVRQLFATAEQERSMFYVPLLVLLETIWVLESAYQVKRSDLIETISELLLMPVLQFEQREAV